MAQNQTYSLLDSGNFMKLEQVGPYRISRPAPSAVWLPNLPQTDWKRVDATFQRFETGSGEWTIKNQKIKTPWTIQINGLTFNLKLTGFGHLGIFPEQTKNWLQMKALIAERTRQKLPTQVLNLFAYTGGSTLFSAQAGADVVHLDASKSSVAWARENAVSSHLEKKPVRWIIDDVQEFVDKEIRREKKYHGIILDPPSYGRGSKNQVWKIEEHLMPLLVKLKKLMADDFSFFLLSCHSPGYTPVSLKNQINYICGELKGDYDLGEMLIDDTTGKSLPSGAYAFFQARPT